jgi:WD40 repeat protein
MRITLVCVLTLAVSASPARAQDVKQNLAEGAKWAGGELLKGIGSRLTDKGLDYLWGSDTAADQRVAELQGRLKAYEDGLRQVDAKSADQISALRRDLSSRTTPDDVRRIVNQTLASLEARTGKLEYRQDALETRVAHLEGLLGYIPTVQPAPLLASASEESGKPAAHPLMAEWLNLLLRSEESRRRIDDLRRTRPDTSKVLQETLAKDKELLAETEALNDKVMKELAEKLPKRQALLAEFRQGTPEVRKFDESLTSVTWLAAVTRPVASGPYAGRLAVPRALFGFDAPDVIRAFDVAKADRGQVVALYEQYLLDSSVQKPFLGVSLDRRKLTTEMADIGNEAVAAALRGFDLARRVLKANGELQAALKELSALSPEVLKLRGEQDACMAEIRTEHQRFAEQLARGAGVYVEAMERERPTTARMTAFRDGILLPLAAWSVSTRSQAEGFDRETWDLICDSRWEQITLKGHSRDLMMVAISPDGNRLATASEDKSAKVWDAKTGNEILTLRGHTDFVIAVAWSPDGKRLATSSTDKTARIWDAETGKELFTLTAHTAYVYRAVWSPDGKRLATPSADKTARIWDAETGKELFTLTAHTSFVYDVAWSPDGKRFATTSEDRTTRIWDAETGKEILVVRGRRDLAWSPDGKRLASDNYSGNTVKVWDAETGKDILVLGGHTNSVAGFAWSPDGTHLATTSLDETAKIWDAETGKELFTLTGHEGCVRIPAWSPDGKRLFTAASTADVKNAKIWDAKTGKELLPLLGHTNWVTSVAWSPDGKWVATASQDRTARVWPLEEAITRASQNK